MKAIFSYDILKVYGFQERIIKNSSSHFAYEWKIQFKKIFNSMKMLDEKFWKSLPDQTSVT